MKHKCRVYKRRGRWTVTCLLCGPNGDRWSSWTTAFDVAFNHAWSYK